MINSNNNNRINNDEEDLYSKLQNDINIFPSFKKELIYDINKDKYYLYENNIDNKNNNNINKKNKIYQSNILGKKIIKLNNNFIGKLSYQERLNKNLIEKFERKYDETIYHPRIKYFNGFSQIPRPVSQPLFNYRSKDKENKQIIQSKENIVNYIKNKENIISDNKYKEILNRNSSNDKKAPESLNYFSISIADEINSKNKRKQRNNVIKFINISVNNVELNSNQKLSLNEFKTNLLINANKETDRTKSTKPNEIFKNEYKANSNIMLVYPFRYSQSNHDFSINSKIYSMLYNSINNNKLTRLIHNNGFLIKKRKINKSKIKFDLKRPNSVINITNKNQLFIPQKREFNKIQSKRYDTEREYKEKFNNKNDKNNINIHSMENINQLFVSEKRHISGYKKPWKKPRIFIKSGNPRFRSGKDVYKKELDLLKLVNPEVIKREEDENKKRNQYLKRKLENDRQIQLIKDKKNINIKSKGSRLDSAISNLIKDLENVE